jgi:preprotein translocase subunit Sec63
MVTFEQIDEARRLLGLSEAVSMKEIKQAYRRMAFRYHPDRDEMDAQNTDRMKRLNWAYKLLRDYCACYRYTFRREDVARVYPEEEYLRKYTYGWFDGP